MALARGDRLGPYEIQALLGAGGMGEVYRAADPRLGREVALKVIAQKLIGDADSRRRFENEARAASALNHPAIVTIYDIGESGGVSWIAMEWVEGRTLRDVLEGGPLPIAYAWTIAKQVAGGLAAAHAKGIVHRDLKPENVMVTADGRAKILDFGLARQHARVLPDGASALETMAGAGATFAGTILGTVGYMSPEQAAGRVADFRSDQFSLGAIVYELLTGARAFSRPTAVETLSATIRDEPIALSSLRPEASDAFQHTIAQCLAKRPEDRFAQTSELVSALDAVVPESLHPAVTRRASATDMAGVTRAMAPRRTSRMLLVAIAAAVGALVLAGGLWNRFGSTPAAIASLAVLPFENTAEDPNIDYLSDGLTESLIEHLSRVSSLKVMARGTVMRFKGLGDPQSAGRSLGVGAVVTGTVARRGDQVIIATELINTATGERLWGQTYDRPFADLFRVQDSIVSSISDGLRLRLSGAEKQLLAGYGTDSIEAYELYLKGRHLMAEDTEEGDLEAKALFLQAVEKDPKFVQAHLDISSVHARRAGNGYAPPREELARVAEQIRKIEAIDPTNVVVRAAAANNRFQTSGDWAAAEREYRALIDEPGLLRSNQFHPYGLFLVAIGRSEEAVALTRRALINDPGNAESRIMLGAFLKHAGQLDEALNEYDAIAADNPRDSRPHFGAADVHQQRGDIARAAASRHRAYELELDDEAAAAFANVKSEADYELAEVTVARLQLRELEELAKIRYISPLDFARLHALAGNHDKAFSMLEEALKENAIGLILLKADRAWDSIRSDPRFAAMVRRVGIP